MQFVIRIRIALFLCALITLVTLSAALAIHPIQAQGADGISDLASCPATRDALDSTLPVEVDRGVVLVNVVGGTGGTNGVRARIRAKVEDYRRAGAERAAASGEYQPFRDRVMMQTGADVPVHVQAAHDRAYAAYQPHLARFQRSLAELQDELEFSRRVSALFWTRGYRARGASASSGRREIEAEREALALAFEIIERIEAAPGSGGAKCRGVRTALAEAAMWSVVSLSRNRLSREPTANRSQSLDALRRAKALLALESVTCTTSQTCVLAARIALFEGEAAASDRAAARRAFEQSREFLRQALRLAASEGPSAPTAEAWMVLAELDSGVVLDRGHVNNAFVVRQAMAQREPLRAQDGDQLIPNSFRHRLLPIYQAAADAAYAGLDGGGRTAAEVTADLLTIGEASRRAQIEIALADSCEPLEVPLRPQELRPDETIVYPVVGTATTYLLVGINRAERPAAAAATPATVGFGPGWRLLPPAADSEAAAMSARADRLVAVLQSAASEYAAGDDQEPLAWGGEEARWLFARLIEPLSISGLVLIEQQPYDAQVPTLIFFPDPTLRNLPWALLHRVEAPRGSDPDYLVRSAAIAVAPALAYMRPLARPERRGGLLAGGFDRDGDEGLAEFVETLPDYGLASRITDTLPGDSFTEANLYGSLGRGRNTVLLLATHAVFMRGASHIFVRAPDLPEGYKRLEIASIERRLRLGRRRTNELDLLILLSCEGATGDAGELGLAGAALRGGAAGTIGSVIRVAGDLAPYYFAREGFPDEGYPDAGGSFIEPEIASHPIRNVDGHDIAFLTEYYRGLSPAQALRRTQLAAASSNAGTVGYEANWGAFVVVGNWR